MNLIYATRADEDRTANIELAAKLADLQHDRVLLVHVEKASTNARISSNVMESGIIQLNLAGTEPDSDAAAILSLCKPNIPTAMIWDNLLPSDHPLLKLLSQRAQRTIVSIIPPCGPATSMRRFLDLRAALAPATILSDVAESMFGFWQDAIAKLLDSQPKLEQSTDRVEAICADDAITVEMLYIFAWITVVLKWRPEKFIWRADSLEISCDGNRRAVLGWDGSRIDSKIELSAADAEAVWRIDQPRMENRWDQLLLMQLKMRESSLVREAAMNRIEEFIGAIEIKQGEPDFNHA
jgi:glucose-6-phosphate dehydrogenase assembly protein OpcA